jgi:hypothetical protein
MGKIFQSPAAKRFQPINSLHYAGVLTRNIYEYQVGAAWDGSEDILELGCLLANTKIAYLALYGTNFGAVTATVGLMGGTWGDPLATRTIATQIATSLDINDALAVVAPMTLLGVAAPSVDTGLGVVISGDEAAAANKKITMILDTYHP